MKKILFLLLFIPGILRAQLISYIDIQVPAATPTMSATPTTLTLTSTTGTQGVSQSIALSWTNLGTNAITIPAPTGYVVSLNNSSFSTSQTISSPGASGLQTVYYALASSNSPGTFDQTSTIVCTALSLTAPVTLNGTTAGIPALSASPLTLTLTSMTGTQGAADSTTVTGSYLGSNVVSVSFPTGYVYGLTIGSMSTSAVTITPSSGSVSQKVYYALASGNTAGTYNTTSSITCSGAGVSAVTVTLDGTTSASSVYAFTLSLSSHTAPSGFVNVYGNPNAAVLSGTNNGVTLSTVAKANWAAYSSNGSSDNGYGLTGSSISYFPDSALYNSFFTYSGASHTADSASQGLSKPNFILSGLTAGQSYTLRVASTASSSYGFTCNNVLRAEGSTTQGVLISNNIGDVRGNTTQYYLISGIIASSTGTISIWTFTTVGQQIFWTNAIKIQ
jgi:hypothetical protein